MSNARANFELALLTERVTHRFATTRVASKSIAKGTLFEVYSKKGDWSYEMSRGVVLEAKENGEFGQPLRMSNQGWAEGGFQMIPTELANGKILLHSLNDPRTLTVILHTPERAGDRREEQTLRDVLMNGTRKMDDPSEEQAENLLRTKFKYNDSKISKLKKIRQRRSW